MSVRAFYDELAPLYHLVYEDWEASVAGQGAALASIIDEHWGPGARTVFDAAVGIGTQALGLLARGFRLTGSDLSPGAVDRARREAAARQLALPCAAAARLPITAAGRNRRGPAVRRAQLGRPPLCGAPGVELAWTAL
jgi:hypothetical protein